MNFFKRIFNTDKKYESPEKDLNNAAETLDKSVEPEKGIEEKSPVNKTNVAEKKIITESEKEDLIEKFARDEFATDSDRFSGIDKLFEEAARLIVQNQIGSTSLLQRRLKLGYLRAGRLMDQMEVFGIVGLNQGSKSRDVLIKNENDLNVFLKTGRLPYDTWLDHFYEQNKVEIESKRMQYQLQQEDEKLFLEKEEIRKKLLEKERKKNLEEEVKKELIAKGLIKKNIKEE